MTIPRLAPRLALLALGLLSPSGCLTPPGMRPPGPTAAGNPAGGVAAAGSPALEKMTEIDAWDAVRQMTPGINIGNTLDNTTAWETGWGNPPITKEYVASLAKLGFKTVRLPVAWDTYAQDGQIQPDKMSRVREVVEWITGAGMFCVLNIHWDGGWIDSDSKDKFPKPFTFSAEAEQKYRSYWGQIATFFAGKNEKLILESLNEETNFKGEGSIDKGYATLAAGESDLHRHGPQDRQQDRRQQPQTAADHCRVQHRFREDRRARVQAAEGHAARAAVRLRSLLHALPVRRPQRRRRLGEDDAHLGDAVGCRAAHGALRQDERVLCPQRPPRLRGGVQRDGEERIRFPDTLDDGGGERLDRAPHGPGALGHRPRGVTHRPLRPQPRAPADAAQPSSPRPLVGPRRRPCPRRRPLPRPDRSATEGGPLRRPLPAVAPACYQSQHENRPLSRPERPSPLRS